MPRHTCSLLLVLSLVLSPLFCPAPLHAKGHTPPADVERLLGELDALLKHRNAFIVQQQMRIRTAEAGGRRIGASPEARFRQNQRMYDLLHVFSADSALTYANANIDLARQMGWTERESVWLVKKSFVLAATGLLKESSDVLHQVTPATLSREGRITYYTQAAYLVSHMALYLTTDSHLRQSYTAQEAVYVDTLRRLSRPTDQLYLWYQGWHFMNDATRRDSIIVRLKAQLAHSGYDSRTDAMKAYVLARLCKTAADRDGYLSYLIRAAMADIRAANRDMAALEELAMELYNMGELDRAYAYIGFCHSNALYFHNRVRMVSIGAKQDTIWQAYMQRNAQQERSLRIFAIVITLLVVVLIGAICYIRRQMKRLTTAYSNIKGANVRQRLQQEQLEQAHDELKAANAQLQRLNSELKEANTNLREAIYIKEEYISNIFILCSGYISKLDNYRKTINRKTRAGQYADIKRLTDSESMVHEELKAFYHNFDVIFLHLYPDFIDDFNALLQPEARFEPKDKETLNTQLRIYALVRLGINDSVKIAEFLHCSPQTVYNYRLKTRNCAVIPKNTFAATVSRLGKIQLEDRSMAEA